MKYTISVLVENKPGVLARVAGLFSARGYNIASLAVSETLDPEISYMTIVVLTQNEKILEQIKKQLNKLIDVISITDFTEKKHINRELVLIKVNCLRNDKAKLQDLVDKYSAKMIQCQNSVVIIETIGEQRQIKQMVEELDQFEILELIRTGQIAMAH